MELSAAAETTLAAGRAQQTPLAAGRAQHADRRTGDKKSAKLTRDEVCATPLFFS